MTAQNFKIPAKSMKINERQNKNEKKTRSQREHDLRPMFVPTTLAVMGLLSSCPRVMTMQCLKSPIPPPLSTRLCVYLWVGWFVGFVPAKRKRTRLSKILQQNANSKTSEKRTLHTLPESPTNPRISK